ncbi:PREDICTED: SUMO-interacting motif-containing protein 1 isoform X2 [Gekko japonicus]|uniref:SUMO-interacting motif-containing protein 1 isoform X2 n=1 Tax=Gekko japonicus TaxID=146911 RepID=A0ABM1JVX9_GEKJA|nr:PREDICTED: SUMO-interacting motif-containing protein 1 isoform X2 [Gekko japonicus]
MAEGILLLTGSSSDGEASGVCSRARRRRQLRRKRRRCCLQAASEVIDLTGDDLVGKTAMYHDVEVIDLTQIEDTMVSPLHNGGYVSLDLIHSTPASVQPVYSPKILTTLDPERTLDMSHVLWDRKQPSPKEGAIQPACFQGSFALVPNYSGDSESSSHTTFNSDLGSLGSPQLDSDVFSLSPANDSSEHETFQDPVEDDPSSCPPEGDLNPQLSLPDQRHSPSSRFSQCPRNATTLPTGDQSVVERNNSTSGGVKLDAQEPVQQIDIKVWMKTLQYFPGVPVHHPFLHNVVCEKDARQNKQQKARPIPSRRLSMVSSTIEENFFRGTLDFLMDYVSTQYYPPKTTMQDVVRQILLSSEVQQEIQRDAYMLLMKIQALHPAKADTVVWDWNLLHEVMTEQEEKFPGRFLFLNYVIQTLEDDFQTTARQGILHKSIAKKMLSCDQCFSNLKELIDWLVAAVTGTRFSQHRDLQEASPLSETSVAKNSISVPELHSAKTAQIEDLSLHFQSQREVPLLQRMLSIAVEVDKSPICSVNKIAEMVFPSVLNIPERCQREAFLSSMECHLLRCKVLELIFHHSCNKPSCNKPINLPLSMEKILYFLTHLSVPIKYQDNEVIWKRWDEMLHLLNLLVLSYHRIVLGHSRSSVCERINLIIKAAKPKLQSHDSITDADFRINSFQKQLLQTLGQPLPSAIKEKIDLLRVLFQTTTDIYRTFGQFDGPPGRESN